MGSYYASKSCELPLNWRGLAIAVRDVVTINIPVVFDIAQKWRVVGWKLAEGGGVDLTLCSEDDRAYAWNASEEQAMATSVKPDMVAMTTVPVVTDLTITQGYQYGFLLAEWTPPVNAFIAGYDIEYSHNTTIKSWRSAPRVYAYGPATTSSVTLNFTDNTSEIEDLGYLIHVRVVLQNGAKGAWVESAVTHITEGPAPAVATGLSAVVTDALRVQVSWTNPASFNLAFARVYRSTTNSSSTSTLVSKTLPAVIGTTQFYTDILPADDQYYYWVKTSSASGGSSAFSTGTSINTDSLDIPVATTLVLDPATSGYVTVVE